MLQTQFFLKAIFISSTLLLLMTACAEMDSHSKVSRFQQSENTYRASLRWGEWLGAIQLQRTKPGSNSDSKGFIQPSEAYLNHLDTIKVTHIETLSSAMHEDKKTAATLFLIEYRFDNSAIINKIRHKMTWWHDQESNIWYTDTPLPEEFDLPQYRTIKLSPERN